ncbi:MAG: Translation initiation factor IF-2 [Chlamydiia bacterium]|nr:Translation initiation factor IF-2 [Chlamydiia bacterium]
MAKNLKLQIKNKQLAAALKKKTTPAKKAAAAPAAQEKKKPAEGAFVPKAKKLRSYQQEKKIQEAKEKKLAEEARKAEEEAAKKKAEEEALAAEEARIKEEQLKQEEIIRNNLEAEKRRQEAIAASKKTGSTPKRGTDSREGGAGRPSQAKDAAAAPQFEPAGTRDAHKDKKPHEKSKTDYSKGKDPRSSKRNAFQQAFNKRGGTGDDDQWLRRRPYRRTKQKVDPETIIRPKELTVQLPITVKDLAAKMKIKSGDLIAKLFASGMVLRLNDYIDDDTTLEFAGSEFDCEITVDTTVEERLKVTDKTVAEEIAATDSKKLTKRPPVIAFMGHVDHGKTSIIDSLRESNVAGGESGAITQHIGAFRCETSQGSITILDTPGHEAFSAIRERGATVTDIVVIVVAGDEGIKAQTEEAITKAQDEKVPMIFALNKCDKPGFNPENIYRQMADLNLLPEAWGGEVTTINCSAKTKQGLDELVEILALQADMLELKANPKADARGSVIESELHKGFGATATLLVQNGTLKRNDALVFDEVYGRVKTMHDEHNKPLKEAGPSTAVSISGLSDIPSAGSEFIVVKSEKEARKLCEERASFEKRAQLRQKSAHDLDKLMQRQADLKELKVLNVMLKADVQGSLEAVRDSLKKIHSEKAEINIISESVGSVAESDLEHASAAGAIIFGFHTHMESHAEPLRKKMGVQVKLHDIIYHLVDDARECLRLTLDKIRQETEIGSAEIKATFKSSHLGIIAGCQVADGIIKRNSYAKLEREGEVIWEGSIASIKRNKDDAKEVSKGLECGILLKGFSTYEVGDIIRAYDVTYVEQEL